MSPQAVPRRVRPRRPLVLVILGWTALIGALVGLLAVSQANARRDVAQRLQTRVQAGAEFSSLYVKEIHARELAQATAWLSARRITQRDFAREAAGLDFTVAVLLDRHGRLLQVVPSKPALLGHIIIGSYPHLAAAVGGAATVSNVVLSAARSTSVVAFAVPFSTSSGRRVFSGGFNVSKTPLGAYMSHLIVVPGRRVFLVDAQETVIASSRPVSETGGTLRRLDGSLRALAKAHVAGSYATKRGSETFVSASVVGTPWRIIVAVPDAQLYNSVDGATKWLAWVAVSSLALAGLIIIMLGARLVDGRARLATLNGELDRLARVDSLTGLRNRRDIEEMMVATVSAARRRQASFAVLLIDVDGFKAINDTLGHPAGDRVLISIGQTLHAALRVEDAIGRWGGEEFIAVLPGADAQAALIVAERLREAVDATEHGADGARTTATVTVGAAVWTSEGLDDLIRRADAALYAGKSAGRNNVQVAAADPRPELVPA